MNFILSELGATGSVDGDNKLVIKGRFQQKQIESVLKAYIREYVTCHTCRSPNTILTKENRLFFLQCEVRCVNSEVFYYGQARPFLHRNMLWTISATLTTF